MAIYDYSKVYSLSDVNWPSGMSVSNGAPIGTQFTVNGGGGNMALLDDDGILEDNTNGWNGSNYQTLDASQQVLASDFGLNHAGDYVWSRAWQEVTDQYGNVGRIYQIRIGTYSGTGMPDYNSTNVHTYYAFTGPLYVAPGTTYTVTGGFDGFGNFPHTQFEAPVCFGANTLIETGGGLVPAGGLSVGCLVQTVDNGLQPIRWIGQRLLSEAELASAPHLRPIRIRAGALGEGVPSQDMLVSPQHRMLVRSHIAQRMFGASEVLVAAKQLLALDGVEVATDLPEVRYVHFIFDAHQIVRANGAEAESLFAGPQSLRSIGAAALAELYEVFPALKRALLPPMPARPIVNGRLARNLAERHVRNGWPVVSRAS